MIPVGELLPTEGGTARVTEAGVKRIERELGHRRRRPEEGEVVEWYWERALRKRREAHEVERKMLREIGVGEVKVLKTPRKEKVAVGSEYDRLDWAPIMRRRNEVLA